MSQHDRLIHDAEEIASTCYRTKRPRGHIEDRADEVKRRQEELIAKARAKEKKAERWGS